MNRIAHLILIGLISAATTAQGQDTTKSDLTDLSLEELMNVEVVNAASRFDQTAREAPSAVTVITSDEIRLFGYRTLAEVLNSLRGFYVSYDRNYYYLGVRGFSPPGDYNSRILLTLNGTRINESIYNSVYFGTEALVDLDLIDRLEVIRGPS